MGIEKRGKRESKWPAWSGDERALQHLVGAFENAVGSRKAQLIAAIDESRQAKATRSLAVEATAREKDLGFEHSGQAREVLEEVNWSRVSSLELKWPLDRLYVSAKFAPTQARLVLDRERGVSLRVEGDDRAWINGAFEEIARECRAHVPWWGRLRREMSLWILTWLFSGAMAGMMISYWEDQLHMLVATGIGILFALPLAGAAFVGLRHILPGFEVLSSTATGRGPRAVAALAVIATTVAGAVLGVILSASP